MANGNIISKNGFNAILHRAFTANPTQTVPSRFKIGTGTTTPTISDTDLETTIAAWNGGSDYKNYNTAVSFDAANQKVTTQGFVSSTQANGNTITEYGEYNTDGTPVMYSRAVFTGITKTSAVQLFVVNTYRRG